MLLRESRWASRQGNFRRGVWVPAFAGTTTESCALRGAVGCGPLGDEGAVRLMVDEFVDAAGRAAAEFDAVTVEPDDGEGRALIGPQLVLRLQGDLEHELTLGIRSDDVG